MLVLNIGNHIAEEERAAGFVYCIIACVCIYHVAQVWINNVFESKFVKKKYPSILTYVLRAQKNRLICLC